MRIYEKQFGVGSRVKIHHRYSFPVSTLPPEGIEVTVIARRPESHTIIIRQDNGIVSEIPWMFCIAGYIYETHTGQLIDETDPRLPEFEAADRKYWADYYRRKALGLAHPRATPSQRRFRSH